MKLLQPVHRVNNQVIGYSHHCPGCGSMHVYYIVEFNTPPNPTWVFNGNFEKPTFMPSMLVRWSYGDPPVKHVCHYNITDGMIKFHTDCTHKLVGQTVPLPPHEDQSDGTD